MKEEKEKLNYSNLNALIQTARIILKLGLVLAICSLIVFAFVILEKTKILSIIGTILGIMLPLFIGLVVAWLFEPVIRSLEKRNITHKWATSIVYLVFVLIVALLIFLVVPEFVSQLKDLIGQIPSFLTDATKFITNIFNKFKDSEIDINTIQTQVITQFEKIVNTFASTSLSGMITGITSIFTEGFKFILGLLIAFYLSLDYDRFNSKLSCYIPKKYKKDIKQLLNELNIMARGYVGGTLFTSLIVAFLTFLGLLISGVSSPLLFAIFCGITNIIPYFGPYIGGVPVCVIAFSISPMCGIITTVTIFVVQFVEGNIIHPLVVGKAIDIHPVTIVIGLLIFQHFFGIAGMIFAAPIIGACKILFNYFDLKFNLLDRIKPNKQEVL